MVEYRSYEAAIWFRLPVGAYSWVIILFSNPERKINQKQMSGIQESAIIFGGAGGGTFILSRLFRSEAYKGKDGRPDLKKINLTLAIVHATLAVVAFTLLKDINSPEYVKFKLQRVQIVGGTDYLKDPFANKFKETDAPLDVTWGVVSFFAITAFAHLWYAYSPSYYAAVSAGHNPYRWLEYGTTASIMIYLVCMLGNVRDFTSLIPIIGSNIITMYCGFALEEAILRKDFEAAKQFLIVGTAAQIHNFIAIDAQFFLHLRDIQSIENPSTGEKYYKIPAWLYIVVLPTLINFGLFGLTAFSWYKKAKSVYEGTGTLPSYLDTELSYMNLSLFAKSFLGLGIMVGYRNSGKIEDILA